MLGDRNDIIREIANKVINLESEVTKLLKLLIIRKKYID